MVHLAGVGVIFALICEQNAERRQITFLPPCYHAPSSILHGPGREGVVTCSPEALFFGIFFEEPLTSFLITRAAPPQCKEPLVD